MHYTISFLCLILSIHYMQENPCPKKVNSRRTSDLGAFGHRYDSNKITFWQNVMGSLLIFNVQETDLFVCKQVGSRPAAEKLSSWPEIQPFCHLHVVYQWFPINIYFLEIYPALKVWEVSSCVNSVRDCMLFQWVLPEMIPQAVLTVLLLFTGHWILFILYGAGTAWIIYR